MSARIAEIRQENAHGDVGSRDIEWLCKIADGVERLLVALEGAVRAPAETRELRRLFEIPSSETPPPGEPFLGPLTAEERALAGVLTIKLERIRSYGARGDWAGLREYVELNLLAEPQ